MSDLEKKLRETAAGLLRKGAIGYVIGWGKTRFDDKTTPVFITVPEDAERLIWNGYCINGLAKYALDDRYPEKKIGICVRGCDTRAVNRMITDNQLKRENLYLIGLPCDGKSDPKCERCRVKNPVIYDVLLGEPVPVLESVPRFKDVEELEEKSVDERYEYWSAMYDKCIRCYACRNVCPACNCRECYVDQSRTGWQGKQLNRAENQIYGMTRAFHVGDRCIECGECERVCPMNLPIGAQARKILKDINTLLPSERYECGMETENLNYLGKFEYTDMDEFM